ncbi:ABC transporter permease subunit, partial [Klebsiella pneumoniae]
TNLAVYIGIVYAYLPFMVLPIYTALTRIDYSLVEASLDLGARPLKTFFQVIVPLTKGGIIAGSMLLLLIVPIMWFHKHQQKQMGEQG